MACFRFPKKLTARLVVALAAATVAVVPTTTSFAAGTSGVFNGLEAYNPAGAGFGLGSCPPSATITLWDVPFGASVTFNVSPLTANPTPPGFCILGESGPAAVTAAAGTWGSCTIATGATGTWTRQGAAVAVTFGASCPGLPLNGVTFNGVWTVGASVIIPLGPTIFSAVLWGDWQDS